MTRQYTKIQLTEYVVEIPEVITFAENMQIQSKAVKQMDVQTGKMQDFDWFAYMKNAMNCLIKGIYKNEQKINITIDELLNDISNDDGMKIWNTIQELLEKQTTKK